MALVVQMIGLGGGKQNAVDPRPEQIAEQRAAADPEAIQNAGKGGFEIVQCFRPGVEGRERIDQHDLPIEPGDVIAKKRPHHDVLVGLVAPLHHRPQRAVGRGAVGGDVKRRKGQRRRARHVARHQETSGRQEAHGETVVAAGAQIVREQFCGRERRLFVLFAFGAQGRQMRMPGCCEFEARAFARQCEAFGRPLLIAFGEQRQVEQPFAGIVDDVDGQRAVRAILPLIVDHQSQFRDIDGGTWPAPLLDQSADVVLVIEAGHRIVRLRLEPGAGDPPRRIGLEHRKSAPTCQAMDQRRDEHGLAGARQAGDAEPYGGIEKTLAIIQ